MVYFTNEAQEELCERFGLVDMVSFFASHGSKVADK